MLIAERIRRANDLIFARRDERMSSDEHGLFARLPYSQRSAILRSRRSSGGRILDAWQNPFLDRPYRPPAEHKGGGVQGWEECLDSTVADGTAVTAAAITIICPDFSIPAYYMAPGRVLRVYAAGTISTVVTTPGTGVWGVSWGGVAGVVLAKSSAQAFHTTAQTLAGWNFYVYIICRTAGATGTFMNSGNLNNFNVLETTAANLKPAVLGSAGTNSNAAVTVDTTAAKLLSATFTQTVTTGSLVCQQRIIEVLN